jgi:hypothetical protein
VEVLNKQINDDSATKTAAPMMQTEAQATISHIGQTGSKGSRRGSRQSGSAGDEDAEMGDAVDGPQGGQHVRGTEVVISYGTIY